jgi:hypothetical protein
MGLLSEIYSASDGLKRRVRGLLDDPMGTLAQKAAQFQEDQRDTLNLQSNAYPRVGERTVLNSPEQIAGFKQQLASKAADMAMAGATVWHGSPHQFDAFDASKIGTGEGAQVYGHGLYLAEEPKVARMYQKQLSENKMIAAGSEIGLNKSGFYDTAAAGKALGVDPKAAAMAMQDANGDVRLIDNLRSQKGSYPKTSSVDIFGDVTSEAQALADRDKLASLFKQAKKARQKTDFQLGGSLYKVDLPDEHIAKMLDWDKPLSQQTPDVQATLKQSLGASYKDSMYGEDAYRRLQKIQQNQAPIIKKPDGVYRNDSAVPGMTSDVLRNAGIPGIRYLDGGSRGAGAGTSNYVVFPGNEGLLKILERNGKGLLGD